MIHSDNLSNLAAALAKLQGEVQNPKNTATNPFFKNHYAPLNDILTEMRPLLAKHGLSITQLPTGIDTVGVTTMLMHTSGEWIADSVSMSLHDQKGMALAQVAGSIITYLRRYAVSAVIGIASEDDTDGNSPQKPRQSHEKASQSEDGHKNDRGDHEEWNNLARRIKEVGKSLPEDKREPYRREYELIKDDHNVAELKHLVDRMEGAAADAELDKI